MTCTVLPSQIKFKNKTSVAVAVRVGGNQVDEGADTVAFQCRVKHTVYSSDSQYTNTPARYMSIDIMNDDVADAKLWTYSKKLDNFGYDTKFLGPLCNPEGNIVKYGIRLNTEPMHLVHIFPSVTMVNDSKVYLPPQLQINQTFLHLVHLTGVKFKLLQLKPYKMTWTMTMLNSKYRTRL